MKWVIALLLAAGMTSCKPEYKYSGDGALTLGHGVLRNPIYTIQMPQIDISRPHVEKYDLRGIPPSKVYYLVSLAVLSSGELTPSDRKAWGQCSFKMKKNGTEVLTASSEFCKMRNCWDKKDGFYINGLYTLDAEFTVFNDQDHWELIFECPGFDSSEPVWAYIVLHSGGK
jgi:hypothetical protein